MLLVKFPLLGAKLVNACFLFTAVVYFFKTLRLYLSETQALQGALVFGVYPPFLREVHLILTESLVLLLVCGFLFHWCKVHGRPPTSRRHALAASAYLGYLALTKVFFGYVITLGVLVGMGVCAWSHAVRHRVTLCIYGIALMLCLPYLCWTYRVTGKPFYWATSGGMSLYWMSTPYRDEYGDWFSAADVMNRSELSPHRAFFEEVARYSEVQQDSAFRSAALRNLMGNPTKVVVNWLANVGRLLFSYPFSYSSQRLSTYFYMLPNMFLVVATVLSVWIAIKRRIRPPYEIAMLILFALVSVGGTSLLSGYERQFRPLVPILLLWLMWLRSAGMDLEVAAKTL